MCGIAGFYTLKNNHVYEQNIVDALHAKMHHRGPDHAGHWVSSDESLVLLHQRLSIVDSSPAGMQPMMNADKTVVIIFNGEIYNHNELRTELHNYGHIFQSQSDTEIILHAYKQWGIACLSRLRGMFAFALYDLAQGLFFLVRDRIGIKPLYFSLQNDILSFASEIKIMWAMPWISKSIQSHALFHYLSYLATPAPLTFFNNIYKLLPGHYVCVDRARTVTFHRWYNQLDALTTHLLTPAYSLTQLLQETVAYHATADVPSGVLLSGGLDSSLLVALLCRSVPQLKTFTITYPGQDPLHEAAWAQKVAQQFGTDHYELCLSQEEAFSLMPQVLYHQDEPLGDMVCLPLYYLSSFMKEKGIKVVHLGEGADELFCGYASYIKYMRLQKLWHTTQKWVPYQVRMAIARAAAPFYTHKLNLHNDLVRWASGGSVLPSSVYLFSDAYKKELMQSYAVTEDPICTQLMQASYAQWSSESYIDYYRRQLYDQKKNADITQEMMYLELMHRIPDLSLMRVDKMTMAHSIESRVPFLDHRLVEYAFGQSVKEKMPLYETKHQLKKMSEAYLPHEIIYRKKVGFTAPMRDWFRKKSLFSSHLHDLLQNTATRKWFNVDAINTIVQKQYQTNHDYSPQIWALYNVLYFIALHDTHEKTN